MKTLLKPLTGRNYNFLLLILLSSVATLVFCVNYVVDPYNKNQVFAMNLPKSSISRKMNYPLYKTIEYTHDPKPIILLGDSRTEALKVDLFEAAGVKDVYNFSYGGGTLFEAIDTFWFANEQTKLEKVIIGLPFNLFSETNSQSRFGEALEMSKNDPSYYFSSFVTKVSLFNIVTRLTGKAAKSETPAFSKEKFWNYQLLDTTAMYYGSWTWPTQLFEKLTKLSSFSKQHHIDLLFVLPPTHVDLQNQVAKYGLEKQYADYKKALEKLGLVMDFDFNNTVTLNKQNFTDPYHFNAIIARKIVNEIVQQRTQNTEFIRISRDSQS